MSKRIIYYIFSIFILTIIFSSCQKDIDELPSTPAGDDTKVNFVLNSQNSDLSVMTKATSSEHEEGQIFNVYVLMFRFPDGYNEDPNDKYNAENVVAHRWFLSDGQIDVDRDGYHFSTNVDVTEADIATEDTRYTFFVVANFGSYNGVMDLKEDDLNNVNSWADLQKIDVSMLDGIRTVERGTSFLMRGQQDDITKSNFTDGLINTVKIDLERIDSKFRFSLQFTDRYLQDGSNPTAEKPRSLIKITPRWWKLHNMPTSVNFLSGTKHVPRDLDASAISEEDFFSTEQFNFEGLGDQFGREFSFYCLPHTFEPNKSIKDLFNAESFDMVNDPAMADFSDLDIDNDGYIDGFDNPAMPVWQQQWLALREKREKIPLADTPGVLPQFEDYYKNGPFIYANAKAPYVELELEMIYDLYNGEGLDPTRYNATVKIELHLGCTGKTELYPTEILINGVKSTLPEPLGEPYDVGGGKTMDPDSYAIEQNKEYKYNIFLDGNSSILLEATSGPESGDDVIENIPGMSGDLYVPRLYYLLNSGATSINYTFLTDLARDGDYMWSLTTPFSEATMNELYNGNTQINGSMDNIDHKWVSFALNPSAVASKPHEMKRRFLGGRNKKPSNWFFYDEATGEIDDDAGFIKLKTENGLIVPDLGADGKFLPNENYSKFVAEHSAYSDGTGEASGYININQLAQLIMLNAFDPETPLSVMADGVSPSSDVIGTTAYVDEYYYYEHPLGGSPRTTQDGLWAQFVNRAGRRSFSVITDPHLSADLASNVVGSGSVIEQEPIQTYYNLEKAGVVETQTPDFPFRVDDGDSEYSFPEGTKFICYGIEGLFDTGLNAISRQEPEKEYSGQFAYMSGTTVNNIPTGLANLTNSYRSGLKNTQAWWLYDGTSTLNETTRWDKFLDEDSWTLKSQYADQGAYQCLLRNRDENGDGVIDLDEIKWYLPSNSQISYMWIGAGALSLESQLFRNRDYSHDLKYMLSSTVSSSNRYMEIIWLNEGCSTGYVHDKWGTINGQSNGPAGKAYVRCFRNLGTPKQMEGVNYSDVPGMLTSEHEFAKAVIASEHELSSQATGHEEISKVARFNLQNIDPIAYRRYTQKDDLPFHNLSDDHNRPWEAFEAVYMVNNAADASNKIYTARSLKAHNDNLNDTDPSNDPCPSGWRLPNQRELATMMLMQTMNPNKGWLSARQFVPCRTYVRQARVGGGDLDDIVDSGNYYDRYINLDLNSLVGVFARHRLSNEKEESTATGYPRCVRDVNN